jgi:hypothetical protein
MICYPYTRKRPPSRDALAHVISQDAIDQRLVTDVAPRGFLAQLLQDIGIDADGDQLRARSPIGGRPTRRIERSCSADASGISERSFTAYEALSRRLARRALMRQIASTWADLLSVQATNVERCPPTPRTPRSRASIATGARSSQLDSSSSIEPGGTTATLFSFKRGRLYSLTRLRRLPVASKSVI